MNYEQYFENSLQGLRDEGQYRTFADIERRAGNYPEAIHHSALANRPVTVWCSNDYLGMGQHPDVLHAAQEALRETGAGAGGTRNISGTNHNHVRLEMRTSRPAQKASGASIHVRLRRQHDGAVDPGGVPAGLCRVFRRAEPCLDDRRHPSQPS